MNENDNNTRINPIETKNIVYPKKNKRAPISAKKLFVISFLFLIAFLIFAVILNNFVIPEKKQNDAYNNAINLMINGKYNEAILIFEELEFYKRSELFLDIALLETHSSREINVTDIFAKLEYLDDPNLKNTILNSSKILTNIIALNGTWEYIIGSAYDNANNEKYISLSQRYTFENGNVGYEYWIGGKWEKGADHLIIAKNGKIYISFIKSYVNTMYIGTTKQMILIFQMDLTAIVGLQMII